jgi:hypothetical protein
MVCLFLVAADPGHLAGSSMRGVDTSTLPGRSPGTDPPRTPRNPIVTSDYLHSDCANMA